MHLEVVKGQQGFAVLGQASHATPVFGGIFFPEGLNGRQRGGAGFGMGGLPQVAGNGRLNGFGKAIEHVCHFVKPAALMTGARKDLVECLPEAQTAIADSQPGRHGAIADLVPGDLNWPDPGLDQPLRPGVMGRLRR
ncbi:hypothetical protein IT41_15520 [Paracoccus halophilus]|uniref:Uncharacterized protein n=1 Tax=Paracoccus halophilus TaxID=376733 RepID=A0A099EYJ5_9RHOB|nr:hypothetical protein IT41_15520 [Paracoccus halophilus]